MLDPAWQLVPTAALIGAATPGAGDLLTIFAWTAIVALAAVGGIYLARAIRKWTQREQRAATFTIQDLRDMRARGEISAPEFAAMRAALLAQLVPSPDMQRPARSPPPRPAAAADDPTGEDDGPPSPP